MAPVDTYVDPSKASDAGSSPLTSEKSQGQKESDSSDAVFAAQEGPESDGASGNPEGQNQSGGKDVDREKKRGSPRGHDQNRNRPRGVCGEELTLHTCAAAVSVCHLWIDQTQISVACPPTHPFTPHNTVHSVHGTCHK